MLVRKLLLGLVAIALLASCNRENFEKIRLNPDIDFRYNKAFEFYNNQEYQKAQYLFEDLMGVIRLSEKAEKVYFHYAYTHYKLQNFNFSAYYFKQFYNTFSNSANAEEALFMSAESYRMLSPNYRLTQEDTEKAIQGYQLFVNTFPSSERVSISNESIDKLRAKMEEKDLNSAIGYFRRKNYQAARHCFKNMLVDFPDTDNVAYIRYMIIKTSFLYAQQSVLAKQEERYNEVLKDSKIFERKHSETGYAKEVKSIIEICNQRIKKLRNE